jgi:hypothetical protein
MTLDQRLLAAHERGDHIALVGLYKEAADLTQDVDSECFFLTHAYIFALETNDARQVELHQALAKYGRV